MKGHKICFYAEILKIIPKLSFLPLLIWNSELKQTLVFSTLRKTACTKQSEPSRKHAEEIHDSQKRRHRLQMSRNHAASLHDPEESMQQNNPGPQANRQTQKACTNDIN